MPKNKSQSAEENNLSGKKIRVPDDVMAGVLRVQGMYKLEAKSTPTQPQILGAVWRAAIAAGIDPLELLRNPPAAKDSHGNKVSTLENRDHVADSTAKDMVQVVPIAVKHSGKIESVTPDEWRWIERVLAVVRGGFAEASEPLDSNLEAFSLLTKLLLGAESHGSKGHRVSGKTTDIEPELAALRGSQKRVGHGVGRAKEAAGDTEEPRKTVRKGGGRNP